jgi:hypothetical protein
LPAATPASASSTTTARAGSPPACERPREDVGRGLAREPELGGGIAVDLRVEELVDPGCRRARAPALRDAEMIAVCHARFTQVLDELDRGGKRDHALLGERLEEVVVLARPSP